MGNMMGIFELLIGAYVLYCAATGKGQLYKNDNIKKGMEELYKKRLRLVSTFLGPVMIATGIVDMLNADRLAESLSTAFTVLFIVSIILIAVLVVITLRMTDRTNAKREKSSDGQRPAPRAAFEFDEEEDGNNKQ